MTKHLKLAILITIFAGLLRFYHLNLNPPSLNLDEVAIGYNAYSILKTGRDEYGTKTPIAFRSHDDYKSPLYIYLTVIPVKLFGLNAFAVRSISALSGTLTIFFFYLLLSQVFKNQTKYTLVPILASLLLAISPWHIQFSRAAFETNLALFLVTLGVWAYFRGRTKPYFWLITSLTFALSIYAYHTNKLFIPLFIICLYFPTKVLLAKYKRYVILSAVLFILITAPLVPFMLSKEGQLRLKGTSVFETPTSVDINHEQKIAIWRSGKEWEAKIFHDEKLVAIGVLVKGYFTHFTYDFLFGGEAGPPKNMTPNVGLLYIWQLPFILAGIYAWIKDKFKFSWVFFSWFLLASIASAVTWDVPSSTRTELIVPVYQLFTAVGLVFAFKNINHKLLFSLVISLVGLYAFTAYLHNYYRVAPTVNADAWQYGYREAALTAKSLEPQVNKIIVSTNLKQPQNFFAFYLKYDPVTYIFKDGGTVSGGFNESKNHFSKYYFHPISWNEKDLEPNTLYIDFAKKVDNRFHPVATINLPNGQPNIIIYYNK